jgi:3-oxoacyl-[acyl-carrier-protein] synthase-3
MEPQDRKTYPLFGDGAGAVLLAKGSPEQGLLSYTLGADGSGMELLYRPSGGSRQPIDAERFADGSYYVRMDGRPVFKWAIRLLEDTCRDVIRAARYTHGDIDLWVMHQANLRIIDAAIENMGIDRNKVVIHLDRYGNTSAGSVPIALDESCQAGRVRRGDAILMSGFGAGLSWGTAVMRW